MLYYILLIFALCSSKEATYQGSTPADLTVRKFLGISLTDSIDFIRWTVVLRGNNYELDCRYGVGKPNTSGFKDEKRVVCKGPLSKQGNYLVLQQENRSLNILEVNLSLLHLMDESRQLLVGNGGFSYALNNKSSPKSSVFNYTSKETRLLSQMAFQGRTPCKEIANIMGLQTSAECFKKKWYVIFCLDDAGKPSYYLQGGRLSKKERGNWEVIRKNGRIIYKLTSETYTNAVYLLKADDNILFFTDAEGNLLVGNEDFSYTLNRRKDEHPVTR